MEAVAVKFSFWSISIIVVLASVFPCPLRAAAIDTVRNIVYQRVPGVDTALNSLDLFVPHGLTAKAPVMVFVHGGGWRGGDKSAAGCKPDFKGNTLSDEEVFLE